MNNEIRELTITELDVVSGGEVAGYRFCWDGSTAGGPQGLYPAGVECNEDVPNPFSNFRTAAQNIIQQAQHGGRPA